MTAAHLLRNWPLRPVVPFLVGQRGTAGRHLTCPKNNHDSNHMLRQRQILDSSVKRNNTS